jgi:hypothetical protein
VQAFDLLGIKTVIMNCNDSLEILYNEPYIFPLETEALFDTNYIFATGFDTSDNVTKTDTITLYLLNTITVEEPIAVINLSDNDDSQTINLDNVFTDTMNPNNQLYYEISSNTNETIADVSLNGNLLIIDPQSYYCGTSVITIEVSTDDNRILNYSFNLNVILSEPVFRVYVPDEAFRNVLYDEYGFTQLTNEDSILVSEAESLTNLTLNTNSIYNAEGIQAFVNLDTLKIEEPISELDIIDLTNLLFISIYETNLYNLNTDTQANLRELRIDYCSSLQIINLSNNINLNRFVSNMNSNLDSLDFSNNVNLNSFSMHLSSYELTSLDFSYNVNLERIHILETHIEELIINNCPDLRYLYLSYTYVMNISLNNNTNLEELHINGGDVLPKKCTIYNV